MTKRLLRRYTELGVFHEDTGEKLQQSGYLSELAGYESWGYDWGKRCRITSRDIDLESRHRVEVIRIANL
jgi:hypothetical protein